MTAPRYGRGRCGAHPCTRSSRSGRAAWERDLPRGSGDDGAAMTSLLTRPDRSRNESGRTEAPRPRPLVLIATLGGALAALGPLVVLLAIGVIGWFASDAGVRGVPRDGMRV